MVFYIWIIVGKDVHHNFVDNRHKLCESLMLNIVAQTAKLGDNETQLDRFLWIKTAFYGHSRSEMSDTATTICKLDTFVRPSIQLW